MVTTEARIKQRVGGGVQLLRGFERKGVARYHRQRSLLSFCNSTSSSGLARCSAPCPPSVDPSSSDQNRIWVRKHRWTTLNELQLFLSLWRLSKELFRLYVIRIPLFSSFILSSTYVCWITVLLVWWSKGIFDWKLVHYDNSLNIIDDFRHSLLAL